MLAAFIIASWVITLGLRTFIKRSVTKYEENQIVCGRELSPTRLAQKTSEHDPHLDRKFDDLSITARELQALQRTPTFQLWAENKSRTITRMKLERQQKSFALTILLSLILVGSVVCLPFSHPLVASQTPVSSPRRTLWEIAQVNDGVFENKGAAGVSSMGIHCIFYSLSVLTIAAACFGIGAHKWGVLKALYQEANSLVSFMATTNHDPVELSNRLDAETVGSRETNDQCGPHRSLIVFGLFMLRFGHLAASAFDGPVGRQSGYERTRLFAPVSADSYSLGFIVVSLAALLLIIV